VKEKQVFFVTLYERVQLIAENYIKNDLRNNESAVLLTKDRFNKTTHMDILYLFVNLEIRDFDPN